MARLTSIEDLLIPYDADELRRAFAAIMDEHIAAEEIGRGWFAAEQAMFDFDLYVPEFNWPF